jgi:hypothetical protein
MQTPQGRNIFFGSLEHAVEFFGFEHVDSQGFIGSGDVRLYALAKAVHAECTPTETETVQIS